MISDLSELFNKTKNHAPSFIGKLGNSGVQRSKKILAVVKIIKKLNILQVKQTLLKKKLYNFIEQ